MKRYKSKFEEKQYSAKSMKRYKQLYESHLESDNEILNSLADLIESKVRQASKEGPRRTIKGQEFVIKEKGTSNIYSVEITENNIIWLHFYTEIIIKGDSLADPSKAYQTTSAHYFKKKKYQLRKDFENEIKAIKAINNYFDKLEDL